MAGQEPRPVNSAVLASVSLNQSDIPQRKYPMFEFLIALVLFCALTAGGLAWFLRNPVFSAAEAQAGAPTSDPARLEAHVRHLAASEPARAYHNVAALNAAAEYVETEFRKAGCEPARHRGHLPGRTRTTVNDRHAEGRFAVGSRVLHGIHIGTVPLHLDLEPLPGNHFDQDQFRRRQ